MHRRHMIILVLVFVLHTAVNLVWLKIDKRPPVWDMALHQEYALNFYGFFKNPSWEAAKNLHSFTGNYPPLFHFLVSVCFLLFHKGPHIAVLANMPSMGVILWGTYAI